MLRLPLPPHFARGAALRSRAIDQQPEREPPAPQQPNRAVHTAARKPAQVVRHQHRPLAVMGELDSDHDAEAVGWVCRGVLRCVGVGQTTGRLGAPVEHEPEEREGWEHEGEEDPCDLEKQQAGHVHPLEPADLKTTAPVTVTVAAAYSQHVVLLGLRRRGIPRGSSEAAAELTPEVSSAFGAAHNSAVCSPSNPSRTSRCQKERY